MYTIVVLNKPVSVYNEVSCNVVIEAFEEVLVLHYSSSLNLSTIIPINEDIL